MKNLKRSKWPTIRNLVEFMYLMKSRTFFYDDELLSLIGEYDLDYDICQGAMAQVGWLEVFTHGSERMHYRPVWEFNEEGKPIE